jgi:hypothetical protein
MPEGMTKQQITNVRGTMNEEVLLQRIARSMAKLHKKVEELEARVERVESEVQALQSLQPQPIQPIPPMQPRTGDSTHWYYDHTYTTGHTTFDNSDDLESYYVSELSGTDSAGTGEPRHF